MNIQELESLMTQGQVLYQQGEFAEAQKVFVKAKLTALGMLEKEKDATANQTLEELLHGSNRVLAITHVAKGTEKYTLGVAGYNS